MSTRRMIALVVVSCALVRALLHGTNSLAQYTEPESNCSYTLVEWLNGPCTCYGANGVEYDSCENAIIDPNDPTMLAVNACYYSDPDFECYTSSVPCGIVVRLDHPCDESGEHLVVATFPTKPPCGGTTGACTDNHGGHWP